MPKIYEDINDLPIEVESTVEAINNVADQLEYYAASIRRDAQRLKETQNLDCVSNALNSVSNCYSSLRLDLLVVRPLRAINWVIVKNARDSKKEENNNV